MSVTMRRNACPSLAAPMPTGDGLLARINTVDGSISPRHLRLIAEAAERHGNGILEVTRRGSLQIRGLTEVSAPLFSQEILGSGINVRSGVPVESGPLAGLDPFELMDGRSTADQIIDRIEKENFRRLLAPKFSIVVDGGGQLSMRDVLADVRLTAVKTDAAVQWKVSVGGTETNARPVAIVPNDRTIPLAIELFRAVAGLGRAGRGKDLSAERISQACQAVGVEEFGSSERRWASADKQLDTPESPRLPVGFFRLKAGRIAFGMALQFGQATTEQIKIFSQTIEKIGIREFRLAFGHALLAICDDETTANAAKRAAEQIGFIVDTQDTRLRIVACAGAPACTSATIHTKDIATEIAARSVLPESGLVHVSGCEKGCSKPPSPAFSIIGTPDGARIVDGSSGVELDRVAEREVAAAFQRVMSRRDMGRETVSALAMRHGNSA